MFQLLPRIRKNTPKDLVGAAGLEPATLCLEVMRVPSIFSICY